MSPPPGKPAAPPALLFHKAAFDLVVNHLEPRQGGLALTDRGLAQLVAALAAAQGEARVESLLGVLSALDFLAGEKPNQPAVSSLLGVFLATLEQTHVDEAARENLAARFRQLTGSTQELKVLGHGPRPEGTVPAGPGARFAVMGKATAGPKPPRK